ncbi:MAG: hypothetical protein JHD16_15485 [Solirubrobacteraceae bacterium]|nr:hypothetical protein [Solirubrobacteraceae bacterium]
MPRLRPALALLSLALVMPFAACGDGQEPTAEGHTEAVYITTGGLRYQVQISRKLNPYDIEDRDYFVGVKDAAGQVANPKDTWFGVFLRVENISDEGDGKPQTFRAASEFKIEDNEGNHAEPTPLPAENIFAYRPVPVAPGAQLPKPSSTAMQAPIGGALLLFKVDQGILERRPTKLHIESADGSEAEVNLDI